MKIKSLFESKFIKVFDLQYQEGRHYYNATRRDEEDLVAAKSTEEFKKMLPDAVSCVVIWNPSGDDEKSGHEPCLLMNREFRYPTGQYLLSVPAGLIDPEDCTGDNDNTASLIKTAMRELHEETGLKVTEEDEVSWELVKNDDALYCKAEENGYSYATTDEDGYEKVDGYTLTISGEGNIADFYG